MDSALREDIGVVFTCGRTKIRVFANPAPDEAVDPSTIEWRVEDKHDGPLPGGSHGQRRVATTDKLRAEVLGVMRHICTERRAFFCYKTSKRSRLHSWGRLDYDDAGWAALCDRYMGAESEHEVPATEIKIGEQPCELYASAWGTPSVTFSTVVGKESATHVSGGGLQEVEVDKPWRLQFDLDAEGDLIVNADLARVFPALQADGMVPEKVPPFGSVVQVARQYAETHGQHIAENVGIRKRNEERRTYHLDDDRDSYAEARPKKERKAKREVIVIENPTSKERLVDSVIIPARTAEGVRVELATGESVRIVGPGIDQTWRIGDVATWVREKYETRDGLVYVYQYPVEKVNAKTITLGGRRVDIPTFVEDQTQAVLPEDADKSRRVRVKLWAKPRRSRIRRRQHAYGGLVEWGTARDMGLDREGAAARCTAHGTVVDPADLEHSYHLRLPRNWCPGCKAARDAEQLSTDERYARHGGAGT